MDPSDPLSKVLFDNTSGSSSILKQLVNFIMSTESDIDWYGRVTRAIEFGLSELVTFQIVVHFLETLKRELENIHSEKELRSWIRNYEKQWATVPDQWTLYLLDILKGESFNVAVHSQSESLKTVMKNLSKEGIKLKIFQTQSSPANEGELQAVWLANKGLEVVLSTDALAPSFIPACDLVLMGCDGIYTDGFVNKAGSLALCLAAKEFSKPVYVLTDSRKISSSPAPKEKSKPVTEISAREHPNLKVLNFYFETVPHHLVTGYITEKGILEENPNTKTKTR